MRSRLWTWILAVVLLALLVWVVGRTVTRYPRPEIGVSGEESPVKRPTPPAGQRAGDIPRRRPRVPAVDAAGSHPDGAGGGDSATVPAVPVAPSPRR